MSQFYGGLRSTKGADHMNETIQPHNQEPAGVWNAGRAAAALAVRVGPHRTPPGTAGGQFRAGVRARRLVLPRALRRRRLGHLLHRPRTAAGWRRRWTRPAARSSSATSRPSTTASPPISASACPRLLGDAGSPAPGRPPLPNLPRSKERDRKPGQRLKAWVGGDDGLGVGGSLPTRGPLPQASPKPSASIGSITSWRILATPTPADSGR